MPTSNLYSNLHDSKNAVGLAEQCVEILPVRLQKPLSIFIEQLLRLYQSDDRFQNELIDCIEVAVEAIPREDAICIHVAFANHFEPAVDVRYKQASLLPAVAELYSNYPLLFLEWFNRNSHQYNLKANWANRPQTSAIKAEVSDAVARNYICDSYDVQRFHKSIVCRQLAAAVLAALVQDFDNLLQKSEISEERIFIELLTQLGRNANMLEVIDFVFVSLKSKADEYSLMEGSRVPANAGQVVSELEKNWLALKSSSSWQLRGTWSAPDGQ